MALSLGNPNISGSADYVRRSGGTLLWILLPFYALGIFDGCFLPLLVRSAWAFAAYDIAKFVILPAAILFYLQRRFQLKPADYCFIGGGID